MWQKPSMDKNTSLNRLAHIAIGVIVLMLSACAANRPAPTEIHDPLEAVNRAVYSFNDKLDRYALKPVAKGYKKVTPSLVRRGVSNFFGNLGDVSVAANSLLQGKFEQSLFDTARVAVNTVIGLGGVLDIATKMDLVRHNEDFGQTLGVWGVPEGPYLVLPFFGSQTLRGTVGLFGDSQIEPLNSSDLSTSVRSKLVALNVINARSNLLAASSILDTASLDPYVFVRDGYLNWRRRQVHDGVIAEKRPTSGNEAETASPQIEDEIDFLDEIDELDQLDENSALDEIDLIDQLDDDPPLDEIDLIDQLE